jgi:hypothetical protein
MALLLLTSKWDEQFMVFILYNKLDEDKIISGKQVL